MRLNEHFCRGEFACKCGCGVATVDAQLLEALTYVREYFGKPVHITSGFRCEKYNSQVGGRGRTTGSLGSRHMYGQAADFVVDDTRPDAVQALLKQRYPDRYGIGCYARFTHLDVRLSCTRWH